MKKQFNGMEFTTCTFVPYGENERIDGLFVHNLFDEFGDGDGVVGNACEMPTTEEEADIIIQNEWIETESDVLESVEF